jgi:hypothetical protein
MDAKYGAEMKPIITISEPDISARRNIRPDVIIPVIYEVIAEMPPPMIAAIIGGTTRKNIIIPKNPTISSQFAILFNIIIYRVYKFIR